MTEKNLGNFGIHNEMDVLERINRANKFLDRNKEGDLVKANCMTTKIHIAIISEDILISEVTYSRLLALSVKLIDKILTRAEELLEKGGDESTQTAITYAETARPILEDDFIRTIAGAQIEKFNKLAEKTRIGKIT